MSRYLSLLEDTPTPRQPKADAVRLSGEAPCPTCGCGGLWRDTSGAWRCEQCHPPGAENVAAWRNFSGAKVPPMPPAVLAWPDDLTADLRRVSAFYEWTDADRSDFIAWARRSPEGLADAAAFIRSEAAKLPRLIDGLATGGAP